MSETIHPTAIPMAAETNMLSYVSLAGEDVPAATRENSQLLQHAADYQTSVRNLRWSGAGDIAWGAVNAALGAFIFHQSSLLGAGLTLLGGMLMGVGLWIIIAPSPLGMIFDGVVLLLVAAWNAGIAALVILYGNGQPPITAVVLCLSQVYWGIHRIRRYPRFAAAVAMQPSRAVVKFLGELAHSTLKAKPRKEAQVIEFKRQASMVYERWKGRLLPEVGVFVSSTGSFGGRRDVLLATPESIEISEAKKKLLSKKYRVKLVLKDKRFKAVMPGESLEKLRAWMGRSVKPADVE